MSDLCWVLMWVVIAIVAVPVLSVVLFVWARAIGMGFTIGKNRAEKRNNVAVNLEKSDEQERP